MNRSFADLEFEDLEFADLEHEVNFFLGTSLLFYQLKGFRQGDIKASV
jgi:hypothetical protein